MQLFSSLCKESQNLGTLKLIFVIGRSIKKRKILWFGDGGESLAVICKKESSTPVNLPPQEKSEKERVRMGSGMEREKD